MDLEAYKLLFIVALIALLVLFVLYLLAKKSANKLGQELNESKDRFSSYKSKMEPLKKYQAIKDAESEAKRIQTEARSILEKVKIHYDKKIAEANELANSELKESRVKAKAIRERAEKELQNAHDIHDIATKIEVDAKAKAEEIAGDAWEAKQNAEQYESTVKAMKNIIQGYGDEYLIPNQSVLDELAQEYDHKEAGRELAKIRTLIKSMIKNWLRLLRKKEHYWKKG